MESVQLAQRIRAFRKLKGYTQQEFANKINISVAVLGAVERGNKPINQQLLIKIAQGLNISVQELTELNG
ncbi:helix-turn-helix transcriptional regulator [Paenibacillus sediminis]|uniref:Transcriptional regulator with XRE-family HTH domain n=1 Tax=Paenibacillus sediminis TaxID=664909 RepID=A0ABS4H7X7_9BACL|nr:helix-turn-helix transcriptional regulator [Paenibacillus sediminis]MBP1938472.1 transcriptional regulator with XRE-family HTH domain [Paenibacillus sediminis]